MLLRGDWLEFDDGVARPVIFGEVLGADGAWFKAPFLVDTGADRTVLSASLLAKLKATGTPRQEMIQGVGGNIASTIIATEVRFTTHAGSKVGFRSDFAALTQGEQLDICVLGRDVTDMFAVIVDRAQDFVGLISLPSRYSVATAD